MKHTNTGLDSLNIRVCTRHTCALTYPVHTQYKQIKLAQQSFVSVADSAFLLQGLVLTEDIIEIVQGAVWREQWDFTNHKS